MDNFVLQVNDRVSHIEATWFSWPPVIGLDIYIAQGDL